MAGLLASTLRILVVATFDGRNASVIRDFLFTFRAHSRHRYYYLFDPRILDRELDLSTFDAILIFWSVDLLGPDLSQQARERIRAARAFKLLLLQDEYRDVRPMNAVMSQLGVQLMLTCVAERDHETFYPASLIPSLEATYTVLSGYVPDYLGKLPPAQETARAWEIGYRSRVLPYYLGDLAREKWIIAQRFQEIAREHSLRANISTAERDRLYGRRWLDFLRSSRFVLGSASGASVVDFTGEIRRSCERYLACHPGASYQEVKQRFFADVDGKVVIETISPRVFEAAALGCVMVQHEGAYSGLLEPDRHYICVRRDYTNIPDVIDRMKDRAFCRELARNAHADLIASGRHSYRAFAERFDALLARHAPLPSPGRGPSPMAFHIKAYLAYSQSIIPCRDRYLVAPSWRWVEWALRAALGWLTRRDPGSLLARFTANPEHFLARAAFVWRLALATPIWRRVLGAYLCNHRRFRRVKLHHLLDDIHKLEIVRRARAGTLRSRQPFDVILEFDPGAQVLALTSVRPEESARQDRHSPPEIRALLEGAQVPCLIWDHSAFSLEVVHSPRGRRWLSVFLGATGVHRFDAITALTRSSPIAARALVSGLHGCEG